MQDIDEMMRPATHSFLTLPVQRWAVSFLVDKASRYDRKLIEIRQREVVRLAREKFNISVRKVWCEDIIEESYHTLRYVYHVEGVSVDSILGK